MNRQHGIGIMDRRRFVTTSLAAAGGALGGLNLASAAAASEARAGLQAQTNLLYWQYIGLYDPTEVTAVKRFQNLNSSVKVRYESIPWNQYWQKLGATLTAGDPPDVWNTAPTFFYEYINRGQLANLDTLVKNDYNLKDCFGKTLYMWQSPPNNGPYYGIPRDFEVTCLFYRPDMFHKAGIKPPNDSWTMSDVLDAAKELTLWKKGAPHPSQWGFVSHAGRDFLDPLIYADGGRVLSEDHTQCMLDQPAAIATIQSLVDMIYKYKVSPSPATYQNQPDPFASGNAAMVSYAAWYTITLNPIKRFPWDMAMMPKGKVKRVVLNEPDGIVISKATKDLDASWKLAKYIASSEIGLDYYFATGLVPASKTLAYSKAFLKSYRGTGPGSYDVVFRSEPYSMQSDYTAGFNEWQTAKQNALALSFLNQSSVADACKKASQAVDEVLQRNSF